MLPKGLSEADTVAYTDVLRTVSRRLASVPTMVADRAVDGATGSNSWVVSGDRTATGKPILANDPHLATSIPSTFTQIGLHCRTVSKTCPFEVTGYSFSGMPGVVIGRNASMAWGLTTSYVDAQDLYLEEVRGDTVRVGDTYQPLTVRTEEIKVAGEDTPRTITVRSSRHGPLLSDASNDLRQVGSAAAGEGNEAYGVSLAWTGLQPNRTMDALLRIDTATTFTQFRAAAKLLATPSQNLVYADNEGTIGYQLPGAIPERGRGDGDTVSPGWDTDFDWKGLVPFEELPWAENPEDGFIVTANNQIIGKGYPRHLGSTYSYGWRSQEIVDALSANPQLSVAQSLALQGDDTVRFADQLVPRLLKLKLADPWVAEGQQTLVGWDYSSAEDSAAAAYFFVVVHDILERTFRDQMPPELWPTGGDRWNAVLTKLLDDPNNAWWDDENTKGTVEKRDDILRTAMTDARKELTSLMSRDTPGWQWGKLHRVTLRHQTLGSSGIGPIERLFNRGRLAGRRWSGGGERDGVRRHPGLPGDRRTDDADGGGPGGPGQLPVDQPERHLGPRLPPELRRPGAPVGDQPDSTVRGRPLRGGGADRAPAEPGPHRLTPHPPFVPVSPIVDADAPEDAADRARQPSWWATCSRLPSGSCRSATRSPQGMSVGGLISVPPAATRRSAAVSASVQ